MKSADKHLDEKAIETWLVDWIHLELQLPMGNIDRDATFLSHGMNSMTATMLVGDLEELLDSRLSPTLAWDFPTIARMAGHLATEHS